MMTTGTVTTVTGEASGIGPWIAGSEAEVRTGEDPTAATDQIMTEGERRLATGATSGAESGNGRDTGTGTAEDHHLWKGPTKKSIRDLEAAPQVGRRRGLAGKKKKTDGATARARAKRRASPPSRRRSWRRRRPTGPTRTRSSLSPCGFAAPTRRATTPATPWTRGEILL